MREFLRFVLIGFSAGWIASIIVRGRIIRIRGCLSFLIFGIAGALAAGYALDRFGLSDVSSVVAATAGATLMLVFLQVLRNA